MRRSLAEDWLEVRPEGLYCNPAGYFIDPGKPVHDAIVTHGHADHARPGHDNVIATPQTHLIMQTRYVEDAPQRINLEYRKSFELPGGVNLWLAPAGHIFGSAQVVLEYQGQRVVISGDYKRHFDPTCAPFEVVPCDVFVTEATFALPVFTHPVLEAEVDKLMRSLVRFPDRAHLVGVYALGKCQRVMMALRSAGYKDTIYLHGALVKLTELYEACGMEFGDWKPVSKIGTKSRDTFRGKIVLSPPSAIADRWSRRFPDPVSAMASGWMQIRARARQRRAELPLIVSDHADWPDLLRTIEDTGASDVWITHGRVDALQHALELRGINAKALDLIGREEEAE
ncbi:MAG: ligase-associated DNA damage response exonuclease [Pseudomonadota bacterium]